MRYLLDTDHISILQQQSGPEYPVLLARMTSHPATDFAYPIISFHEQVLGAHTYLSRARRAADLVAGYDRLGQVLASYAPVSVLPFDARAATILDSLIAQRVRIGTMDLRIAVIALASGMTLLTRNTRDFGQVPGLVTQDWTV